MAGDPTHPRHRQTLGDHEPTVIAKADGRVWRVNYPIPGVVTVEHPGGRVEELTVDEFLEREEQEATPSP